MEVPDIILHNLYWIHTAHMILCWIWQISGVYIAWETRRPSHRVKDSSVTGTVSEFCGSVVRLVSKFWKTWWTLHLFHWKAEILVWVLVFQAEEESVQKAVLAIKGSLCGFMSNSHQHEQCWNYIHFACCHVFPLFISQVKSKLSGTFSYLWPCEFVWRAA
jgi:hypothetical protein